MTVSSNRVSPPPAQAGVSAVVLAYAAADPAAAFRAIDAHAHAALGHALCTVNRYDAQAMRVVRLYSSNPEAYPPGGSKDKNGTAWGRHVLLEQKLFVGEGEEAIREFFDDHDAIQRLGLRSVINVPIVYGGVCLGTVNFLMPRVAVSDADVEAAQLAGLLALPAFQALQPPA
ncbi:GAF domain-containing protein [Achromobacter insolitus]|uniref:GAF domain-containing protein n=1 Tax=Achromobacter insolitus TaxID=217204 RepID=UPI00244EBA63|nr:GAF domain-containing protein [Achromobacter insolitus]MDH3063098.1 GAF domain-containing protein [Achromobacter insolitus]